MKVSNTVSDQLAEAIKRQIIDGTIPAGMRLMQNNVAKDFQVSSTPVREAFSRLAAAGVVTFQSRKGVQVVVPTLDDIKECYAIRGQLEPLAVEWAGRNFTEEAYGQLRGLILRMDRTKDTEEYIQLNTEFIFVEVAK